MLTTSTNTNPSPTSLPLFLTGDYNPMLQVPEIAIKSSTYKEKQHLKNNQYRRSKDTEEHRKRSRAILYCSALNTGKIQKINLEKLSEHSISYDDNATRFIVS